MLNELVSVIVPVYNKEEYLDACLESIVNQSYKNLEIIIINDGSKDGSDKIINNWKARDSRIVYLEHSNIGLGPTRNRGLSHMKGEAVAFVDADDTIHYNMIENMKKELIDSVDVVVCETLLCDKERSEIRKSLSNDKIKIDEKNIKTFFELYYYNNAYSHNACDKLYRSSYIKKHHIEFGDNKEIFAEDTYFNLQIIVNQPTIFFLAEPLYNYFVRNDSIMNSYKPNLIDRNINLLNYAVELFEKKDIYIGYLYLEWLNIIILELNNILESNHDFKDFRRSMIHLRRHSLLPKKMKNFSVKFKMIKMESNYLKRFIHTINMIFGALNLNILVDFLYYFIYKIV